VKVSGALDDQLVEKISEIEVFRIKPNIRNKLMRVKFTAALMI
jgi:phage-related protein